MGRKPRSLALLLLALLSSGVALSGCDPVTRYKVAATVFDGVPSLPPQEEYCREYYDMRVAETARKAAGATAAAGVVKQSVHPPYEEKKCDDCHDKNKTDGLVRPQRELCYVCHKDFIKGDFVHGPVAVADCLFCHVPHDAAYQSLLKADPNMTCNRCHLEKRIAGEMHNKVMAQKMNCIDCHNPHYGTVKYFLK